MATTKMQDERAAFDAAYEAGRRAWLDSTSPNPSERFLRVPKVREHLQMTTTRECRAVLRQCIQPGCDVRIVDDSGTTALCAEHRYDESRGLREVFADELLTPWQEEVAAMRARADARQAAEGNIGRFLQAIPAGIPAGRPIQSGDHVMAHDRANFGRVVEVYADRGTARVWFWNKERNAEAEVELPLSLLERQ